MRTPPAVWLAGARPRTLPAAIVPVLVGSGVVAGFGAFAPGPALLCLALSIALQVGVNYANDYSDGIRGTDAERTGPARLVGQHLATPRAVRTAAVLALAVAALLGVVLVLLTRQWWLLPVGASALPAAWLYTGGPRPYGYAGLGEVMVLLYFGLVAVIGTAVAQSGRWEPVAALAALPVGLLASAILMANNIRDRAGDAAAGKRTLAVRLGQQRSATIFIATIGLAFLLLAPLAASRPWSLLALASLPAALPAVRAIRAGGLPSGLPATARLHLLFGILLAAGLAAG